ncbi:hypothetical protein AC231_06165 [Clostridium pasteurianum]|nr:hypothetical protein [Clostridium pasteurianum]AOZ76009.1 hypothetical protein AQ983_13225 [Clostridium pasteurianum DSM 525 = ATCC 6013]ELP60086.1 hypothetical protein F502_05602 [Clostridium pasteurianum DSM 525 = ATCC 6013]OMH20330.1 hypothetical protein AC231_06165 [Clostridium pasteurianum]
MIPSETQFNDTVQEILKGAEYKHLNNAFSDMIEGIKETLIKLILKVLENTFSNMSNVSSISENLSTVFIIIGILILLGLIIFISIKISKSFEKRQRIREILGEKIDNNTTPNSLRHKADNFRKQKDFRKAIRYEFIALLLLMHTKGVLYLDEAKTNREIYEYLEKNKISTLKAFKYLSETFNECWYGHKLKEDRVYDQWQSNMSSVWNEVINLENKNK